MPAIFISYRKEDTPGAAAHLYKNLSETFGPGSVYMDVARSQPGRDVRQVIDEHLDSTVVVLVIIGKEWADATDDSGQRRLDSPLDVVRIETAAALKRDIPVIPVLVQGAGMVQPAQLPPDLADLAFRNPVTLLQSQWGSDVETLVTLLQSLVHGQLQGVASTKPAAGNGAAEPRRADAAAARDRSARTLPSAPNRAGWMAAAVAAAVVGLAYGLYSFMQPSGPPLDKAIADAQQAATEAMAKAETAKAEARAAQTLADKNQADRDAARAAAKDPNAEKAEKAKLEAAAAKPTALKAAEQKAAEQKVAEQKIAEQKVAEQKVAEQKAAEQKLAASKKTEAAVVPAVPAQSEPAKPAVAAAVAATAAAPAAPPALPPLGSKTAKALNFPKWTLKSGGCGAGPLTIVGTARFSIEKTSDGVVVTEEFRGSGNGFDVEVSGQVEYRDEQPSYDIPTTGQWTSPNKTFKTTGTDRVNTGGDGVTPRSANVVTFQSICG